jgi:hypothetical protein
MAINKEKLLDPIDLELQAKYQEQGVTRISNNDSVVKRDSAGNIELQENKNNPLLIIEPIYKKILNSSVIKILDTQFNYFKFPVRVDNETIDLDFDISLEQDSIFARYKPSDNVRLQDDGGPDQSDVVRPVLVPFDRVVRGNVQENTSKYTINEEIKNSGVDLRFDIKIQHRFDAVDVGGIGVSYFYISREGPDKPLQKNYLGPFANTSDKAPDTFGSIGTYQVQTLNISRIITNDQFEIGDTFFISAIGDPNENTSNTDFHTVNSEQTYWVISDASKNVDDWNQEIE